MRNSVQRVVFGSRQDGHKRGLIALLAALACLAVPHGDAAALSTSGISSFGGSRVIDSGLVVPSLQLLDGGEQRRDQREARRANPLAVIGREVSRGAYRNLDESRALRIAKDAFPTLANGSANAPLAMNAGDRIVRYTSDNAAQIELAGGKHAMVLSAQPIAAETSSGRRAALDLHLQANSGAFVPKRSAVKLRIPRRLAAGVSLAQSDISVTPTNDKGTPVSSNPGASLGASVDYANTETDSDTLVNAIPRGVEITSLLRSPDSPETLYLKLGLPRGSHLVKAEARSGGAVRVMRGHRQISLIAAPRASDAEGTAVPVSMSVRGTTLVLRVPHRRGDYRYPIAVDPTVEENLYGEGRVDLGGECQGHPHETLGATWAYFKGPGKWVGSTSGCNAFANGTFPMNAGDYGFFYYKTQGESRIYKLTATTEMGSYSPGEPGAVYQAILGIENVHSGKAEATKSWIGHYETDTSTICALSECAPGKVEPSNSETEVFYEQLARETSAFSFVVPARLISSVEYVLQEAPPTASIPASEQQTWKNREIVNINSRDPGVGLVEGKMTSPTAPGWTAAGQGFTKTPTLQHDECYEAGCGGTPWQIWPSDVESLPNGEDTVEATVTDAAGLTGKATGTLKIDHSAPYNLAIASLPHNEIGFGVYKVKTSANEGNTVPSSGIASMKLKLDGKELGTPHGTCSPGPCSANAEWTIVGSEYAVGAHLVELLVTSGAGVTQATHTTLTIHAAEGMPIGPGSVNQASGGLTLRSSDVAIAAPGAALTLERSYNSRQLASEGAESPFGRPWQAVGVTGVQSLTKLSTGGVLLTASSGQQSIFAKEGAIFVAPPGDANLTLTEVTPTNFTLKDQHGAVTTFTVPQGGSGSELTPSQREVTAHAATTKFTYETVGGVTRPTQELAPVPAGVSCTTLVDGCRALQFVYATSTTATGEAPNEWGAYAGRLTRVNFTAYNPSTAKMQTTAVAEYAYDKPAGRLRAAWDPRISPALKTAYGYDAENNLTAVTPPGQQPWLINYGTTTADATPGRVVSVARPPASTASGNGSAPASTEAPKLSTSSPIMEHELTVSSGQWSNSPLTYSYQWERCNAAGGECTLIPGAIDAGYVPRPSDGEHSLVASVTATNAGGSSSRATSATSPITVKPHYKLSVGEWGTAAGQFKSPAYVALASPHSSLRLFVTDSGNNRVEELNAEGLGYTGAFGAAGAGKGQFNEPIGIASQSQTLNSAPVAIADSANKRVSEYSAVEPTETERYNFATEGAGKLGGVAMLNEDAFVAQSGTPSRLVCDCAIGHTLTYGSSGSGNGQFSNPTGLAVSPTNKDLYVVDTGNNRVEYFTTKENTSHEVELAYAGQFGEAGTGHGQFNEPKGIAIDASGDVWVVDSGNYRVQGFDPEGKYITEFGEKTSATQWEEKGKESKTKKEARERAAEKEAGPGQLYKPVGIASYGANLYVVDAGDSRVEEWTSTPSSTEPPPIGKAPESAGNAVTTIEYRVPVSGAGAPYALKTFELGQTDVPTSATAVFPPDEPMGWPANDYKRATIHYRDDKDREVNTALSSGGIALSEYNTQNDVVRTLSPNNRAAALKEGANSVATSKLLDSQITYNAEGTEVLGTLGPQHSVALPNGKKVTARRQVQNSYDEGAPSEGGPYRLQTKMVEGALVGEKQEDTRTTLDQYGGQSNLGWSLRQPTSLIALNPEAGKDSVHTSLFNSETGAVTEERKPANPNAPSPHAEETVYYVSGNSSVTTCGKHPEWANLPCQTRPAVQPETPGVPNLPVTTIVKYNVWDEPEETTEAIGASTRTATSAYDAAGRETVSGVTATVGASLPPVKTEYDKDTGMPVTQSTSSESVTKTLHSVFNSLLELTSYTDADGNTATFSYDIDGRPETINDAHGSQTIKYSITSGLPIEIKDSGAGTFGTVYDLEGKPTIEGFPNGMSALRVYNQVGEGTSLEYVKTRHCESNCTWFHEEVVPSIHGQTVTESSTLSSNSNSFDPLGRLVEVKNTPVGKGCKTRVYGYDEDTNRTSLTTYEPSSTGKCSTKTGVNEKHTYDEADRLTDPGAAYNELGDLTGLSEADGGGATVTSGFYVTDQLQSVTQHESATQKEESLSYYLDPAGRTRETIASGQITTADTLAHYDGPGRTPAWTTNATGEWTRNIVGIGGGLVATQSSSGAPVLQLADLRGDVVATAASSETATALTSTNEPSEYGVPTTGTPPKYSWLGTMQLPTELPSGIVSMGARAYVPTLGRFLQPDPIPGGSANAYAYTFGDPIDTSDPSGAYTVGGPSGALIEAAGQLANEAAAEQAAINAAARREAEERAARAEAEREAYWSAFAANQEAEFWAKWNAGIAAEEPTAEWLGVIGSGATISSSIFTKGWEWVKKNAKRIITVAVGGAATVVIGGVTLVSSLACAGSQVELGDEAECWKVAVFGAGFTVLAAGTTVKAWVALKEQRP